ncbi:hypothetical protein SAMIE_1005130 [Sphingobium amiense]|uniref:Muconolactone isomerase domain-containing protein n=1 Tax=Sphingobium amiense TaxID=135719 RepID=A0A494W9D6_9SPHN|nr:muconolactone Delta-isomerase family protein [Sphingobium amiense]BBD97012.1 hypothetical protein SAMIE_1005130 [Sphingobium amiense]
MSRRNILAFAAVALLTACAAAPALAQAAPAAQPQDAAKPQLITRILAVGKLTEKATPDKLPAVLAHEVPATLQLYLNGKIADWYAKPDQTGVVFLLNVTSVEEAHALLEALPLGQAGMMTFELTPLGPLLPLGRLLPLSAK